MDVEGLPWRDLKNAVERVVLQMRRQYVTVSTAQKTHVQKIWKLINWFECAALMELLTL